MQPLVLSLPLAFYFYPLFLLELCFQALPQCSLALLPCQTARDIWCRLAGSKIYFISSLSERI